MLLQGLFETDGDFHAMDVAHALSVHAHGTTTSSGG